MNRICREKLPIFVSWIFVMILEARSQDFNPTLFIRCINGFLGVSVRTPSPFHGIVYADGHREECFVTGNGLYETTINIPLTAIARCGLSYDEETEQYFLLLQVREHPMIILQQDRTFNVSCPNVKSLSANSTLLNNPNPVHMGVFEPQGLKKLHKTLFGSGYSVKIWSSTDESDFMVTSCMGFSGHNYSISLTDHNGCSTNTDIMSNFVYSNNAKSATAHLYSMFKFPSHDTIHLQCAVVYCAPACNRIDCERRRDDPISTLLNDGVSSDRLVQERFASTTVRVADAVYKSEVIQESTCGYHHHLLSAMSVLFGCLFLAALCVNCIFCALTGYCCCSADPDGDQNSVQYVTTDLKAIDAMNSTSTAVRQYPALPYGHQLSLPPFYNERPAGSAATANSTMTQAQRDSWAKVYAQESQKSPMSRSSVESVRSEGPLIRIQSCGKSDYGRKSSNHSNSFREQRVPPPTLPRSPSARLSSIY